MHMARINTMQKKKGRKNTVPQTFGSIYLQRYNLSKWNLLDIQTNYDLIVILPIKFILIDKQRVKVLHTIICTIPYKQISNWLKCYLSQIDGQCLACIHMQFLCKTKISLDRIYTHSRQRVVAPPTSVCNFIWNKNN